MLDASIDFPVNREPPLDKSLQRVYLTLVIMQIIESVPDFHTFLKEYENQPSILVPVFCDSRLHPAQNRLCLLGVYGVNTRELVVLLVVKRIVLSLQIQSLHS